MASYLNFFLEEQDGDGKWLYKKNKIIENYNSLALRDFLREESWDLDFLIKSKTVTETLFNKHIKTEYGNYEYYTLYFSDFKYLQLHIDKKIEDLKKLCKNEKPKNELIEFLKDVAKQKYPDIYFANEEEDKYNEEEIQTLRFLRDELIRLDATIEIALQDKDGYVFLGWDKKHKIRLVMFIG